MINILIDYIFNLKKDYNDIYVCGTSVFRDLKDSEREDFLKDFFNRTGLNFNIISCYVMIQIV